MVLVGGMFANPSPEIALYVLTACTPCETFNMEITSKRFQLLVKEHEKELWKMHLKRQWPIESTVLTSLTSNPLLTHKNVFKAFATRVTLDKDVCNHIVYSPDAVERIDHLVYIVSFDGHCGLAKWGKNSDGTYLNGKKTRTAGAGDAYDVLCWSPPARTCVISASTDCYDPHTVLDAVTNGKTSLHILDTNSLKCVTIVDKMKTDEVEKVDSFFEVLGVKFVKNGYEGYGDWGASIFGYESVEEYAADIISVAINVPAANGYGEHHVLPDNIIHLIAQPQLRFLPMTEQECTDENDPCFLAEIIIDFGRHGQPLTTGLFSEYVWHGLAALVDQSTTTLRSFGGREFMELL